MIFYPRDYWHQTLNTAVRPGQLTVGVFEATATDFDYKFVEESLRRNCNYEVHMPGINPSPALCAKFQLLFDYWENTFGTCPAAMDPALNPSGDLIAVTAHDGSVAPILGSGRY